MHFFLFLNVLFFGCVPQTEDLTVSNEFQEEFVRQVNRYRTEGCHCGTTYMPPVEPISWNDKLPKITPMTCTATDASATPDRTVAALPIASKLRATTGALSQRISRTATRASLRQSKVGYAARGIAKT